MKDKNVFVEPSNWLLKTQNALGFFYSAESRTTSRTFAKNEERHIERLAEVARSPEVTRLYEMFMDGYRKAGGFDAE